jgi:hypothetical protein
MEFLMLFAARPHPASRPDSVHQFLLLAPLRWQRQSQFDDVVVDELAYHDLLGDVQRFRGQSYLADGALRPADLAPDGRHQQPIDPYSWHLVIRNEGREVVSCARYYSLPNPSFETTLTSRSRLAKEPEWESHVRSLVEHSIRQARDRGAQFAELGGWCVAESARKTSHALRSVLTMYALGEILGGTVGLSTATTRHSSSSILQRLGANKAGWQGITLPTYFEPLFDCDMELLQFDSAKPAPKYAAQVAAYQHHMRSSVRVVCCGASAPTCARSLQSLAEHVYQEGVTVSAPPLRPRARGASIG